MDKRIFYMDAMRGILMMLGLVYHSAKLFSIRQDWAIYATDTSVIATFFVDLLHIFRMPTFFVVSGYFAAMTLQKYGPKKFLKVRLARIMIPLVVTALTLNSIQALLLVKTGWLQTSVAAYITHGGWVTHLWFLLNLVIYFILAALIVMLFKAHYFHTLERIDKILLKIPFSILLTIVLPLFVMVFLAISKVYPIHYIIKTELLFRYMPFFFFGMLLFAHKGLLNTFTNYSTIKSGAIMILSLGTLHLLQSYDSYSWFIFKNFIFIIGMWGGASLCFHLFKRFANYHSKLFLTLSEMSYTVYLFHHLFVIMYGLLLLHFHIEGIIGFALLVVMVAITSTSIHLFVISRYDLLSYLFNGKHLTKR